MNKTPKYYRARIALIKRLMAKMDSDDPARVLLRNGVFPDFIDEINLIKELIYDENFSNSPLTFEEITSFNTWFNIHPEKVAGKEIITSSREFPITIKGTKDEIISILKASNQNPKQDFQFQLKLKTKTSKAKLKLLKL